MKNYFIDKTQYLQYNKEYEGGHSEGYAQVGETDSQVLASLVGRCNVFLAPHPSIGKTKKVKEIIWQERN